MPQVWADVPLLAIAVRRKGVSMSTGTALSLSV
jgi:hypothetical protein